MSMKEEVREEKYMQLHRGMMDLEKLAAQMTALRDRIRYADSAPVQATAGEDLSDPEPEQSFSLLSALETCPDIIHKHCVQMSELIDEIAKDILN